MSVRIYTSSGNSSTFDVAKLVGLNDGYRIKVKAKTAEANLP